MARSRSPASARPSTSGVLDIRIPKHEERKPRRIEVTTGTESNGKPATIEGTSTES
jgi:hypothetical protein